jgi:hypothetical protein
MSYILILITLLLALASPLKDKHSWVGKVVIVLILVSGAAQCVKQYLDSRDAQIAKTKDQNDINTLKSEVAGLQGQVKAANAAQTQNTTVFLDNFNRLHGKVGELQTKVTTEELRKQLASVQSDLKNTQKALAPGPKAKLLFTFEPFRNPPTASGEKATPVTEIALSLDTDNTVRIPFSILNMTDVTAVDGMVTLFICGQCKFATESLQLRKVPGDPETQRNLNFDSILPQVAIEAITMAVTVPHDTRSMAIGMRYRCRNCVIEAAMQRGVVHIARPFVRPNITLPKANNKQ